MPGPHPGGRESLVEPPVDLPAEPRKEGWALGRAVLDLNPSHPLSLLLGDLGLSGSLIREAVDKSRPSGVGDIP